MDRNRDGKLQLDEIPEQMRPFFQRADANKDGVVTREEIQAARQPGPQSRQRQSERAVEEFRNVAYVKGGHERQTLDVYVPEGIEGKNPVVVWIHGGGWQNGSKDRCPIQYLLDHGYVVASINYRLSGHAIFPAQLHDCKAAIRFLKANADKYHIDADRIGVWGSSAGGHLVALLGTTGDAPKTEGDLGVTFGNGAVQAVCDFYGPTDFLTMDESNVKSRLRHNAPGSPEAKLLGGVPTQTLDQARAASPLTYISAEDPPFLIYHGDKDPVVPLGQSQVLERRLEETGVPVELIVVAGGGHGPFHTPEIQENVLKFFDRILKAK
ncbi:alpha/beta hydrolase fold domain-containing protein [Rubinisphaera margarita]|uniref:alpha/beta hydrolase fold domain-containing protein n=1 Tax=Rubinisphaera margarita TaxID=2909586 RepID=UPI001EE814D5|nr:alpha/beta hydrolase fold domain-containing protein [Rubinisphaera margarita]MCG6156093.1 alpha/beta hydrolase fold domain-containing protein [Rubinisphaera margarita]